LDTPKRKAQAFRERAREARGLAAKRHAQISRANCLRLPSYDELADHAEDVRRVRVVRVISHPQSVSPGRKRGKKKPRR
jgi:hypothetical protein